MALTFEHYDQAKADRMADARSPQGIDHYLGIEIEEFEAGRLVAGFDARDELITMIGNMHGGCLAAFVDHLLGTVMYPIMPPKYWAATTEWKINYLSPVRGGRCRGVAEVISMTTRTAVVRIEVTNDDRPVALAQGTCLIVAPKTDD